MKKLKSSQNKYYKVLCQKKKECWKNFLQDLKKELRNSLESKNSARCWLALRYTASEEAATTPVIKRLQGQVVVTVKKKEAVFQETIFPPPPNLGSGKPVSQGKAHEQVIKTVVRKALFNHAVQKASEIDRLNF